MSQSSHYSIRGLHTSNSDIAGSPDGSLAIAKNLDLSKINLAQCRRGFNERYADTTYVVQKFFDYKSVLFAQYNNTLNYYSGSAWLSSGSLTKPSNALVPRAVAMNQNLYISSSTGLKKLDSSSGTLYSAGIPGGLMMTLTAASGTGTAVTSGSYVAYRYLIGRYDANNNFIRGAVSGRETIQASGADKNFIIQGFIPTSIDNTYIIQVYRSGNSSASSVNDELQLCYELPVSSAFFSSYSKTFATTDVNTGTDVITINSHGFTDGMVVRFTTTTTLPAGLSANTDYYVLSSTTNTLKVASSYVNYLAGTGVDITSMGTGTHTILGSNQFAFLDITPVGLLGATIYTAPSQQTISNNNYQPPLASDIAEYKQFLFFADTQSKYRFTFTLVSTYDGASAGELRNGDTIVISDGSTTETYTANSTAADFTTKNFKVDQATASLSTRIDTTIRSFISVVNQASSLVYAYLSSTGDTDLPGKLMLESRTLGAAAFYLTSTRQKSFSPQLTASQQTNQTATNDSFRNGLMFSKQGEPEAVPLKNIFKVGSSDDPIKRIVPLRDSLLIFKAKDGIYRLIGDNETNFSVSLLDSTAKIVSPESLVVLNGSVMGLFQSGICSVTDSNVDVVSDPISNQIQTLFGVCLTELQTYSFALGYETEGLYVLSVPEAASATYTTKQIVYNVFNQNFWSWDLTALSGIVFSGDGRLYFGHGSKARVLKENKAYDYTDYCHQEQTLTVLTATPDVTADTTTLVFSSAVDAVSVGDLISQSGLQPSYVTSVTSATNTVVVGLAQTWAISTCTHYKAIVCEIQWNNDYAGNPAGLKHYSACNLLFNRPVIQTATMSFSSDTNPGTNNITITGPSATGAWGYPAWDSGVWGGESSPTPTRIGVPRTNARANNLKVKFATTVAQSDWQLAGLSLDFNPISTRTAR